VRFRQTAIVLAGLNSIVLGMSLAVTATAGESVALDELRAARAVKCTFDRGATTDWDSGKPTTKTWKARSDDALIFDVIDYKSRTARAVGAIGAATVKPSLPQPVPISLSRASPGTLR
jgi:hypothetical protein